MKQKKTQSISFRTYEVTSIILKRMADISDNMNQSDIIQAALECYKPYKEALKEYNDMK